MTQENKKTIDVQSSVVIKQSPNLRQVQHKAKAGLSEEEAIERHTIGNFEKEESEESQSSI